MPLPTDVQTYTAAQLLAAAVAGSGTVAKPVTLLGDHTKTRFTFYNDGTVWRCTVSLPSGDPTVPLNADFVVSTIVQPTDTAAVMMMRLFAAAKIQLGIS